MGQPSSQSEPDTFSAKRTCLLLSVLGLCIVAALVLHFTRSRAEPPDPLQGDSDTATGALEDILQKTPPAQRLPLLLKYVQNPNSGLRYAAVDALGKERGPEAITAIEHAFTDSASIVRQRAEEVLPDVAPERGLRLLLAGLRDEDTWIREAAITRLSVLAQHAPAGLQRALPSLIQALDDPSAVVSTTATGILRHLTGKPWRITSSLSPAQRQAVCTQWRNWWAREQSHAKLPAEFAAIAPIRPTRADPAPDFALQDIDGKEISRTQQHGRLTLLNFWGSWCAPCQVEIPALTQLDTTYRARNLDIIGVALSEKEGAEGLRRWCRAHGVEFRQVLATDAIRDAFGHIEEVPVSVLLDAQGRIRYRWEGERDFATFSAAVERLLHE